MLANFVSSRHSYPGKAAFETTNLHLELYLSRNQPAVGEKKFSQQWITRANNSSAAVKTLPDGIQP